ncbi:alpha-glucuronidase family glycosyl hydrolase [Pedobacter endophyticus]|uniref:Xylan alpha-1,2-glucuronidase n=1 Tax=Pedobacter endophyticus TaxID=2789740 RepID=A0A7S9L1N9_9SPHI|nr:alpha-glucuronidase family glycosyl hydrolase [Pedobacter endophyticus]QPH40861.1 alpha-glucuronidase [Pedobacter endophyticus]
MLKNFLRIACLLLLVLGSYWAKAEDGYKLWLRYNRITNKAVAAEYRSFLSAVYFPSTSPTATVAKQEIETASIGLLEARLRLASSVEQATLIVATPRTCPELGDLEQTKALSKLGKDGFMVFTAKLKGKQRLVVVANEDVGLLYGVFKLLTELQNGVHLKSIFISDYPKIENRILNHWDNLDGSVERGYAGNSIFKWEELPKRIDPRYIDYARANASIGINGTVLNNVNANSKILSTAYIAKVKALANVLRLYGIRVYLTAKFTAPMELGGLKTADPLNEDVKKWWKEKIAEIYQAIPDFGGFCVKANSEGQPGPQDYGRSHAQGANLLADLLKPHNGLLMWRAFVYNNKASDDRVVEAYNEFKPLDGQFSSNVLLQVKNGPIDFQPREPFNPLFGAMPNTQLMLEVQITQEYLGFDKHLVYLAPLFEECLQADTYAWGKGATISKVISKKISAGQQTAIAGVANVGNIKNWTGHPFGQANWFAFGRLAWNPDLTSADIAKEWLGLTFSNDPKFINTALDMMMNSREAAVDYMTPLGLTMLMDVSHYRPAPWRRDKPAPVLSAESFHRADRLGIGYDRSSAGSKATAQYQTPLKEIFDDPKSCPEKYLLWFHHVSWDFKLKSGLPVWDGLCRHYYQGVEQVAKMADQWNQLGPFVDAEQFKKVQSLLTTQHEEATLWRDANVLYFQSLSNRPIPAVLTPPGRSLDEVKALLKTQGSR